MASLLVHHWSHPTTPAGVGFDTVISNRVQLVTEKGFMARAALGEAEVIEIIVDDPNAEYDFKRLHRWYMVETATLGSQLVWNGYIGDQHISRGDEGEIVFPHGAGRRWHLEVVQENALLGYRIVVEDDGDRPAENAAVRLAWLLDSDYLSTVHDHGLIDWTGLATFAMTKTSYKHQTAGDVLRDISLITGYNHYCRYRDASSDIELAFYEPNNSTLDTSTLRVTNVAADIDHVTTWAPRFMGYELHRKGDRVAAGIDLTYGDGQSIYGYSLATSYEFGFIDQAHQANNVTTEEAAIALHSRLLTQHSEQDERITGLRIQVPAARLNDVKHGQRIQAKFSHFPGWSSDWRWARVVSKGFSRPDNETQDFYDVDLELSPQPLRCPNPTGTTLIPPLLNGSESSGVVYGDALGCLQYLRPGIAGIRVPTPFNYGRWHFPEFNVGGIDYAGDCVGNKIRICVAGEGTLTIPMVGSGGDDRLQATLYHYETGIGDVVDEVQGPFLDSHTFEFNITSDDATICSHWVDVERYDGPCGDYLFGYGPVGASWVLTP